MNLWLRARRRGTVAAGLLAAAVGLGGCASSFASVEEMEAIPGAKDVYPGSVVYESTARPPERNLMADNAGMLETAACTSASEAEVARWFEDRLEGAGWVTAPGDQAYWTATPSGGASAGSVDRVPTQWQRQDAELVLSLLPDDGMRWYGERHPERAAEAARAGCSLAYRTRLVMIGPHIP